MKGELLAWAILGHLAGDYLFQTGWMARNKEHRVLPLVVHGLVYSLCIAIAVLPVGRLPIAGLVLLFFSHIIVDRRYLVNWWTKKINGTSEPWLQIASDQTWHLVFLAVAILLP